MDIKKILKKIDGKKSYLLSAAWVLFGVYDLVSGDAASGVDKIAQGLGLSALRHGITSTAALGK